MLDYLKTYRIELTTMSPVFVGSGEKINKKEYIFEFNRKRVIIPDIAKMYVDLSKLGKEKEFEDYMLNDPRDLSRWLKDNGIKPSEYNKWAKYEMSSGDAVFENKGKKEILTITKNPFGEPYIPGSSLKGAIRTAILARNILEQNDKKAKCSRSINSEVDNFRNRNTYMKNVNNDIAVDILHTIERDDKKYKKSDMVNDCMRGIIISDSEPVSIKDIVLCQKIDVDTGGKDKPMPLIRECIRPGVKIYFTLTIDTSECDYTKEYITEAVDMYFKDYYRGHLKKYKTANKLSYFNRTIFIGGGAGYVSKTVSYPILGYDDDGIETVSKIIDNTLGRDAKRNHKHYADVSKGVSPHVLKCTKYNGELNNMGKCVLNIKEIEEN